MPFDKKTTTPARPFNADAVTATIERALESAGLNPKLAPRPSPLKPSHNQTGANQSTSKSGVGGKIRQALLRPFVSPSELKPSPAAQKMSGNFIAGSFSNPAGTRDYKLYIPSSYSERSRQPVPLLVMLHGCKQSPDDFAAGTRMNEFAERHGFLVLYPAQARNANGSKCWNWFRPEDQLRDRGEPSLIAGITRQVASTYRVDPHRIFVAGLSAGAAMAIVLGATYPDLYAAVAAHSGLAYAVAHDVPSALEVMQSGPSANAASPRNSPRSAPIIVFHGDQDRTVHLSNSLAIVEQAARNGTGPTRPATVEQRAAQHSAQGKAPGGHAFTRTIHAGDASHPALEQWVLHGAGHAWSGGSTSGSFTDPRGPDASAEFIRFFLAQSR